PCMEELVAHESTGLRAPARDAAAFAVAIARLARDRDLLERLGAAARRFAVDRFDVGLRAAAYQQLYARWRELYRPRPASIARSFGSRLDRPWLPNSLVRLVRAVTRPSR